ncbi:hypothetical protein A3Q56_04786 [Intoshia linei]|uniref:Uncharacterized protein n=1 Tax=Intoshia linei TaxID=1819745 RepID=A0A177B130_9BILA|nr:hypothetical protein A3Q56_04786 [Intoshia linei]
MIGAYANIKIKAYEKKVWGTVDSVDENPEANIEYQKSYDNNETNNQKKK